MKAWYFWSFSHSPSYALIYFNVQLIFNLTSVGLWLCCQNISRKIWSVLKIKINFNINYIIHYDIVWCVIMFDAMEEPESPSAAQCAALQSTFSKADISTFQRRSKAQVLITTSAMTEKVSFSFTDNSSGRVSCPSDQCRTSSVLTSWNSPLHFFLLRNSFKSVCFLFFLLCILGGHLAAGSRFGAIEDPAGDRRLDASSSGPAAETRGDREPAQCNATR